MCSTVALSRSCTKGTRDSRFGLSAAGRDCIRDGGGGGGDGGFGGDCARGEEPGGAAKLSIAAGMRRVSKVVRWLCGRFLGGVLRAMRK